VGFLAKHNATKGVDEKRVIRASQFAIISSALPVVNTMGRQASGRLVVYPVGALSVGHAVSGA
jgi:hypothetical protein